tara:strand:- start:61 stop:285 length:225 start_codon:yes stop_codon:yes gene_type:complete
MKKNLAGMGIEPQDYKMPCYETWCLSPQDHEKDFNSIFASFAAFKLSHCSSRNANQTQHNQNFHIDAVLSYLIE